MLPVMPTRRDQAGLGGIDATRGIMYAVNSESRFRVSPITRGSESASRFSSDVCGGDVKEGSRMRDEVKYDAGIRVIDLIQAADGGTTISLSIENSAC